MFTSFHTVSRVTQPSSFELGRFQQVHVSHKHVSKRRGSFGGHKTKPCKYKAPPDTTGRKTLVLDLDETLVHSSTIPPHDQVEFFLSGEPEFYVYKRPGLDAFLARIRDQFEVFVFTHGEKEYAGPVLDVLMPWLDEEHRLFRDSCDGRNGPKKDLKLFERKKKNLILVDDSEAALKINHKNTVLITRWMGTPNDNALTEWLPAILDRCLEAKDVRKVIKEINNGRVSKEAAGQTIAIEF